MSDNYLFSVILMAILLVGASLFVIEPLMRTRMGTMFADDFQETPIHHLLSRKDSIYTAMKDLEFDYTTGKLSEDDYKALRDKFTGEAAKVLEEIDVMSGKKRPGPSGSRAAVADNKCRDCGFEIKTDDKFCQSCGLRIA